MGGKLKRITIDLEPAVEQVFDSIRTRTGNSYNRMVNELAQAFLILPEQMRDREITRCKQMLRELDAELATLEGFARKSIAAEREKYEQMLRWFECSGCVDSLGRLQIDDGMSDYAIKGGYVTCPSDWILLNADDAKSSRFVFAVEIAHVDGAPHFLFFSDAQTAERDQEFFDQIYALCGKSWEPFRDLWNQQVVLQYDAEGHPINLEEWNQAPMIGVFPVSVAGDPKRASYEKPPYGAEIITEDLGLYFRTDGTNI